ncbi:hypothetical protein LTR78_009281 [Recurvomyces mirabilis]|uniref:Ankyrin repeat protein n=1 Tax=Recurvomyces mirabilis TaxID=574656 RepID=A0AAE0WHG4_9PEZI|nr:hypothetical protein LTR78_009281 [Recurvomyces mirabilis]KAK5156158.1 hypothetical protein LTS14_005045 [Recurvomyces mirabilis]
MGSRLNGQCIDAVLHIADLRPAEKIPLLPGPSKIGSLALSSADVEAARLLLAEQRKSQPNFRPPEARLRHHFSSNRLKEKQRNPANWTFSKHEIAKAVDSLLSHSPLPSSTVAHAVWAHQSSDSLDELWCHLHDPDLEKRTASRFRKSRALVPAPMTWLDLVTAGNHLSYIDLMCQAGVGQESINKAFGIALLMRNFDAMEILLTYGASARTHKDIIRSRMMVDDVVLARLLLSVPRAMDTEAWRFCLEPQLARYPVILHMVVAQRPDIASVFLFVKAIEVQNVRAAAVLLAYGSWTSNLSDVGKQACSLVASLCNHETRHRFLALFEQAHILNDCPALQQELLKDVKLRQLDTVTLLLRCGVQPDVGPQNAFLWAVRTLDFEILDIFMNVKLSISGSLALASVEDVTPEHDMLKLLSLLAPRGLKGQPLNMHLISAVSNRQYLLVEKMLEIGASTEYDDARGICVAVDNADFTMLGLLLHVQCSKTALSHSIPNAMALRPFTSRLRVLRTLLSKGVEADELERPLQAAMLEHDPTRLETMELLLHHGAPIDSVGENAHNVILAASRYGDIEALELLCTAGPRMQTINEAVPLAFSTIHAGQYDVTLGTLRFLLDYGASGDLVNETLLTALAEDERLDAVRELVEHGADPNYDDGSGYIVALKSFNNIALLKMLCIFRPPNETSLFAILAFYHNEWAYDAKALDIVLSSSIHATAVLNAYWSPELFENMAKRSKIISCFLRHGLDINSQGGSVLCTVVRSEDTTLLRHVLAHNPRLEILEAAFDSATELGPRKIGLECMKLLLESAKSAEIGQSEALLRETKMAVTGDLAGLQLLLAHAAIVNHNNGSAVLFAAQAGALKVLDLLLPHRPSYDVLKQACLAAAGASLSIEQKDLVFGHLLAANAGLLACKKSSLLVDSITALPACTQLPNFLLGRNAEVRPASVQAAIQQCSRELFVLLLTHCETVNRADLFSYARATRMDVARRQWVYEALLSGNIPTEIVSEALNETFELDDIHDLSCSKLLLQHGADVGRREAEVFQLAFQAGSPDAVKLLCQHITNDITAATVFKAAREFDFHSSQMRREVYQSLLQWDPGKANVDAALMETIHSAHPDQSILRLLLARGADPNQSNALCFVSAAVANAETLFEVMSRSADFEVVLQALMDKFEDEVDILRWARICVRCQSRTPRQHFGKLLHQCLRKFPNSTGLLELLLDNGMSTSGMTDHSLAIGWEPEPCTVLLWSLSTKPAICNDAILLLIEKKGNTVLPLYTTPTTGVSAGFVCLLDSTRIPVLQALLNLDRDAILASEIPEPSLEYLGAYPDVQPGEVSAEAVDICMASLFLGNLEAYRMTNDGTAIDDASLHLAALLALPNFVQWLLQTHDPNVKEEAWDFRIPLAVACSARPVASCKIANADANFKNRQQETMQLLARRTDLTIRYKARTVLHLALDDGIQTTRSMLAALGVRDDPMWRSKHIFTDNGGQQHTPEEYIKHVLEGTEAHKAELIVCLKQAETLAPNRQPSVARARSTMTAPGHPVRLYSGARLQRRSSYPHALPPHPTRRRPRSGVGV